ncbi:MAG: DUF2157 domain-containing protein [Burkholderiales bacterium]|nr:DUF2157 domain-containing protein [Burkholderiales bacterium]
MNGTSRFEAQQRADEIRIFRKELARLEAEGIVEAGDEKFEAIFRHHDQILSHLARSFDVDRDIRSRQLSWGMKIASFLGALALAASAFFLFHQFWGGLSDTTQVLILIAAPLLFFSATMKIREKDTTGYFTKLAAMVTFACFVLDISMLGQIFDLTPSDKALLPWAALAFLLAYSCDLRLLLAAGIVCIAAFIAARFGTWGGLYWLDFGSRPENFIPVSVILFFFPQFFSHEDRPEFPPIYRVFAILFCLLPMLVLSSWGNGSYLEWDSKSVEHFYQLAGFAVSAILVWAGLRRQWVEVVNTGVVFFAIFLYTKFYDWWWDLFPKYLFFLVVGLTAVLFLFILKRLRESARSAQ